MRAKGCRSHCIVFATQWQRDRPQTVSCRSDKRKMRRRRELARARVHALTCLSNIKTKQGGNISRPLARHKRPQSTSACLTASTPAARRHTVQVHHHRPPLRLQHLHDVRRGVRVDSGAAQRGAKAAEAVCVGVPRGRGSPKPGPAPQWGWGGVLLEGKSPGFESGSGHFRDRKVPTGTTPPLADKGRRIEHRWCIYLMSLGQGGRARGD